jgi:hypothetical protein
MHLKVWASGQFNGVLQIHSHQEACNCSCKIDPSREPRSGPASIAKFWLSKGCYLSPRSEWSVAKITDIFLWSKTIQGSFFRTFFSGENFAENFPPKMLGKNGIFRGKSFEKSFFQEIPRKVIFRGKKWLHLNTSNPVWQTTVCRTPVCQILVRRTTLRRTPVCRMGQFVKLLQHRTHNFVRTLIKAPRGLPRA